MEISLKKYAPIYYHSAEQPLSITLSIEHLVGDIIVDIEIMLNKIQKQDAFSCDISGKSNL